MDNFSKPLEKLSKKAKEYIDLSLDDYKLKTAKSLSITLSRLVSIILILSVLSIAFFTFAIGLILLIGNLIGSYIISSFIISAIFFLISLILYLYRSKLFINHFIRQFVNVFFEDDDNDEYE